MEHSRGGTGERYRPEAPWSGTSSRESQTNFVLRVSNPVGFTGALARRVWAARAALAIVFVAASAQPARPVTQADLEAVYLYNFGKFVSWPADSNSAAAPFSICTIGNQDFQAPLDAVTSNATLQGRKIVVRHLTSIATSDGCQILFLGESEAARLAKDLAAVRQKPILTVSDLPSFLAHGGMIQFVIQDKRVRFSVNLQPALLARLTVSSELLKVALSVQGKAAEETK